ncbi:MAG TPA: CRISPR-associated endonuclease Cas6, partial [Haloplasmataceae bacterium]
IRGFIANKYKEYNELHNHLNNENIYRYPLIQYKVIDNKPTILAINETIDILKQIDKTLTYIDISGIKKEITDKSIEISNYQLGCIDSFKQYQFITPWMGLNSTNYRIYCEVNDIEKSNLLENILIGNIISLSKGLNYTVTNNLHVDITFQPKLVNYKNQKMICFIGKFQTNFLIPDYLGLGKSVAKGYGCVYGI